MCVPLHEQQLKVDHIEHATKLVTYAFEMGYLLEAHGAMEGHAVGVFLGNAGYEGLNTKLAGIGHKARYHAAAYIMTLCLGGQVDGDLEGAGIGGTGFPCVQVTVAKHLALVLVNVVGIIGRKGDDAAAHLVNTHGLCFEGDGGVGYEGVLDVGNGLGIIGGYFTYHCTDAI